LGIEPFFSHASNEMCNKHATTITKYFVIFGSFICFVIAFPLLKQTIGAKLLLDAIKVVPLIVIVTFLRNLYHLSVWYKLIDKTKIGVTYL
jgi:nitrate/nitrite transporter NarK